MKIQRTILAWPEQGTRSLIELLLITIRCLLSFLRLEHLCAPRKLVPVRVEIAGIRRVSSRTIVPRDDVWLSVSHVLGKFGAPPGPSRDDCLFSAIDSERLEQKRNGLAEPLSVLQQHESS